MYIVQNIHFKFLKLFLYHDRKLLYRKHNILKRHIIIRYRYLMFKFLLVFNLQYITNELLTYVPIFERYSMQGPVAISRGVLPSLFFTQTLAPCSTKVLVLLI